MRGSSRVDSLGGSFRLAPEPREKKQNTEQEAENLAEVLKLLSTGTFDNKPAVPNQFTDFRETCKLGPMEFDLFVVSTKEGRTELNALMAQAHPPEHPMIELRRERETALEKTGEVVVTIWFQRVLYLQLEKDRFRSLRDVAHLRKTKQ